MRLGIGTRYWNSWFTIVRYCLDVLSQLPYYYLAIMRKKNTPTHTATFSFWKCFNFAFLRAFIALHYDLSNNRRSQQFQKLMQKQVFIKLMRTCELMKKLNAYLLNCKHSLVNSDLVWYYAVFAPTDWRFPKRISLLVFWLGFPQINASNTRYIFEMRDTPWVNHQPQIIMMKSSVVVMILFSLMLLRIWLLLWGNA